MRAEPAGLPEGHRRVDAEDAGLVARRADDATLVRATAADDHRLAAQLRPIALLDGCKERVEVDVENRPRIHLLIMAPAAMRGYPRAMRGRRRIDLLVAVAIVATGVVVWATQAPGGSWTVGERSILWPVVLVAWLAVFYLLATDWVWGSWRIERLRRLRRRLWKRRRPDFDRAAPSFHSVMERAEAEVRRLDHRGIGTEHMLLGMLGDPESHAGRLLVDAGLDLASARSRLEEGVGRGDEPAPETMRLTVDGRRAIEIAFDRAGRRGNRPVEDHHLLEGVTSISDSVGVWLVTEAGASAVGLRGAAAALRRSGGG
jgi:hypothetical protein